MKAIKFAEDLVKTAPGALSKSKLSTIVRGFWAEDKRKAYKKAAETANVSEHYGDAAALVGLGLAFEGAAKTAGLEGKTGAYGALWGE